MALVQLDFFEPYTLSVLKNDLEVVKKSNDNVRKGIFARHNQLLKMYNDLQDRLQIIEKNICQGTFQLSEDSVDESKI